eukprot:COSAG02_NODE_503_length_20999_cov_7.403110_20_plen_357_part_00
MQAAVEVLGDTEPSERYSGERKRRARAAVDLAWQMDGLKAEQELERRADLARSKSRVEAKPGGVWVSTAAAGEVHGPSAGNTDLCRDPTDSHSKVASAEQVRRQQQLQRCKALQHNLSVQLQRQGSHQGPFRPLLPSERRRSQIELHLSAPEPAPTPEPAPELTPEPELEPGSSALEDMTSQSVPDPESGPEPGHEHEHEDEQEEVEDAVAADPNVPTDTSGVEDDLVAFHLAEDIDQTDGVEDTELASTVPGDDDGGDEAAMTQTEPVVEEDRDDDYEDGSFVEAYDNVDHEDNYADDDEFEDLDPEDAKRENEAVGCAADKRKQARACALFVNFALRPLACDRGGIRLSRTTEC